MQEYGISARLTFSNSLLEEGTSCQIRNVMHLCELFEKSEMEVENGVIVHSDLLLDYLQEELSWTCILSRRQRKC